MGASVRLREGTGHKCYICNKPITKFQRQINFSGWNAGAIIHSDSMDCNRKKRNTPQFGGA